MERIAETYIRIRTKTNDNYQKFKKKKKIECGIDC